MTVPKNGNRLAIKVRRVVLFDRARSALGGAAPLAEALGITARAVNHKLSVDRGLTPGDILLAAEAVDARAAELVKLAADLRETIA
ncbi:MAG: hypothetical protein P0Y64_02050 [Candidatus Sphingomonas colombiensis]|nr:hypothetical protein [Sphingomonas sp.]WEK43638.1 MAG: hypothetical protein P0Y64_02050 [Sphingomonas sp.]